MLFDRYIGKKIISTTFFAVFVLSALFLLGNIFKEARPLFVGKHPSPMHVLDFILSVVPFSFMFTIPFSFLAAIMLVFGRLSADQEILSMRMAGKSLTRIALPVYIIALLFSGFCFYLNAELAPRAKARVKDLLFQAVKEDPNKFLDPGVVQTQLKDNRIFVKKRIGDTLYGLHIHGVGNEQNGYDSTSYIYAEEAFIYVDHEKDQIQLKLKNAYIDIQDENGTKAPIHVVEIDPVLFNFNISKKRRIKASTMTSLEIRDYLRDHASEMEPEKVNKFRNTIVSRQSFSLACLAFACIGIPLGITTRRKETSTGFVLSLGIGLAYFIFHIFADNTKEKDGNLATLLFWLPNVLALLLGIYLFRRSGRK